MVITIDGPTASGKSSVAQLLAHKLNMYYLNTGMLYRALAYVLMRHCGYTLEQLDAINPKDITFSLDPELLHYQYQNGKVKILFKNEDVTSYLKMSEIDRASSLVSAQPLVRKELMSFQRWFGTQYDVVADGRDTGSVVFPNADYKFYLSASLESRAVRWQADRVKQGEAFTVEQSRQAINERDERDRTRKISPLMIALGAHVIDNSTLDLDQTALLLLSYIQKKEEV